MIKTFEGNGYPSRKNSHPPHGSSIAQDVITAQHQHTTSGGSQIDNATSGGSEIDKLTYQSSLVGGAA